MLTKFSYFVSVSMFHADLSPLCGELTTAMCCLVFVVRLEYAQTLGLSVCRCGLAVRPRPGSELGADCINTS